MVGLYDSCVNDHSHASNHEVDVGRFVDACIFLVRSVCPNNGFMVMKYVISM